MTGLRALVLAVLLAGGCAHSMIEKGQLRAGDLRRMLARTAATRGLPLPEKLDTQVVPRAGLPAVLRQLFYDEWTDAEARAAEEMMTAMGLWPDGLDLLEQTIAVQGEQIAGLYSPPRRTLYIVEGVEIPDAAGSTSAMIGRDLYTEFVLSHEIVHALQHGAFPELFEAASRWKDHDDVVHALHAALEGDAIRYGLEVVAPDGPLPEPRQFEEMQEQYAAGGALAQAPALLRHLLFFPYVAGYPLALAEGKRLLREPPVSTEQALHADRRRQPFSLIDLSAAAGALPAGCALVGTNTMGELLISILMRARAESAESSAWEGWDGDRYLVARCEGERALFWTTRWDTEADAAEFERAYAAIAAAVRGAGKLASPLQIERHGEEVLIFNGELSLLPRQPTLRGQRSRVVNLTDLQARIGEGAGGASPTSPGR